MINLGSIYKFKNLNNEALDYYGLVVFLFKFNFEEEVLWNLTIKLSHFQKGLKH